MTRVLLMKLRLKVSLVVTMSPRYSTGQCYYVVAIYTSIVNFAVSDRWIKQKFNALNTSDSNIYGMSLLHTTAHANSPCTCCGAGKHSP